MTDYRKPDINFPTGRSARDRKGSILPDETWGMEAERRAAEQTGERRLGVKVHERDHSEPQATAGNELGSSMKSHPEIAESQRFDGGADRNLIALPEISSDPEVRREIENQLRLQNQKKLEKQMELGLLPQNSSAPRPER